MASSKFKLPIKAMAGARLGRRLSYTDFALDGYKTSASSGRVWKELWFGAYQILGGEPRGDSACTHATSGSVLYGPTGVKNPPAGMNWFIPTVSACSNACDMQLHISFVGPTDMCSAAGASPYLLIEHVNSAAFTTTGCSIVYHANYNYVGSGSTTTSGCVAQQNCASGIGACGAGARIVGQIPNFPPASPGARIDIVLSQLTACGGLALADVVGIRFRYISDRDGTQWTA